MLSKYVIDLSIYEYIKRRCSLDLVDLSLSGYLEYLDGNASICLLRQASSGCSFINMCCN